MEKTAALCKPRSLLPPGWFGVRRSEDGLVVLGSPIGSVAYVRRTALQIIDRYTAIIPHVGRFAPKIAFPLIQGCINLRPTHACRTTIPWANVDAMVRFDCRISKILSVISKYHTGNVLANPPPEHLVDLDNRLPLDDRADLVRQLAVEDGGMHIRAANQIRESAYAASWLASIKFLSDKMGNLVARLKPHLMSEAQPDYFRVKISRRL
jgi:hypothetical protein